MTKQDPRLFRRHLLERLKAIESTRHPTDWPHITDLVHGEWSRDLNEHFKILESKGLVELSKTADWSTWRARVTPIGQESLEVSEQEWEMNSKPVFNSNTMNIHDSTVGNVAQVAGSHGVTINQSTIANDLKSVHELIDSLLAAIKASPVVDAADKSDAESEAKQLKEEVTKTTPKTSRIKDYLETFTKLATAAVAVPKLVELVEKLKVFLPGIF